MSAKRSSVSFRLLPRTWITVSKAAAKHNCRVFRSLIGPKVKLWGVVKSNAYGHGLYLWSELISPHVDGLCVDSLIEGVRLRERGIEKSILVIGPTLPELFDEASARGVAVSISGFADLDGLRRAQAVPELHVEFDTGFHRRGFYPGEAKKVLKFLSAARYRSKIKGVYTHFASAKDVHYPGYTDLQFERFQKIAALFKRDISSRIEVHAAASGGVLLGKKYHGTAVRVGMGLYGYPYSKEMEYQCKDLGLRAALTWRATVTEVKRAERGAYVGYDNAERLTRDSELAVIPIGYWHGFSRSLSGRAGEVLIKGRRVPVLGRVSMDMIVVDVTGLRIKTGDTATLIGRDGKEFISAMEIGERSGTSHYEFLTRINPLIERRPS